MDKRWVRRAEGHIFVFMKEESVTSLLRWQSYVLTRGQELRAFWNSHLQARERNVLFVLAKGFDPRMCLGLDLLLRAGGPGIRDVSLIEFSEGPSSPSHVYRPFVEANLETLNGLVEGRGKIIPREVKTRSNEGHRITARSAGNVFRNLSEFAGYTDVVLDVSAMPRAVYMPLIAKILHIFDHPPKDSSAPPPNFHVFVWEDPDLDQDIRDEGVDDAAVYLHPYSGGMDREATAGQPKVWIPLLGEGQRAQLQRIHDLVVPDEICPVLPSPSHNPRRGDNLVMEYHDLLFDRLRVEPRNFIFCSEQNPFEVYRQITRAIRGYRESLSPLGGSKFVLSALSSKLLSVGALLVAYDFKTAKIDIGIAHVECHGYHMEDAAVKSRPLDRGEPVGLWLSGEWDER